MHQSLQNKKSVKFYTLFFFSFSLSLSSPSKMNSGFFSSLSSSFFSVTEQHTHKDNPTQRHTNTPTRINQPIAYGSTALAKMPFVGQQKWISGSMVEINIFGSIGSVDQCLWSRSVVVEEIIACGGDRSL